MVKNKPKMVKIKAEKRPEEWMMDELGYFLIEPKLEKGLIYAHHYTKEKKYTTSIVGRTAEAIYYTMLREKLISTLMHAAYVGSELQKAEILVKYKVGEYVQDKALILHLSAEEEE